ncbi:MAG: VWA domain-containing protein [Egibacteraceae bacterium]
MFGCALVGSASAQQTPEPSSPAARIVVLVDESGSLNEEAVGQEREAAALLAGSELSPESEMTIMGFGSSNGPGQNAVTQYCPFITLASPQDRQILADCAQRIHRRETAEGDGTDHAAALQAAVEALADTAGSDERSRIVFLLTDGMLDVRASPSYGPDEQTRQDEGNRRLDDDVLPSARDLGVQVWPLGFGNASQRDLDRFADGAAPGTKACGAGGIPTPEARIVTSLNDVAFAALEALAGANCAAVTDREEGALESGGSLELDVLIPAIASDGVISVTKRDPRVRVTYVDPDGTEVPKRGTFDGQELEVSGEQRAIESLHIRNPKPGTWRVRMEAPAGSERVLVTAAAYWQGIVRSALDLMPILTRPGDRVVVQVRLLTRESEVVTDPASIQDLDIKGRVEGDGFAPFDLPLADDGMDPDRGAGDTTLSGAFTMPERASGRVQVTALIAGEGIVDNDERSAFFTVQTRDFLNVQIDLPDFRSIIPGERIQGTIIARNEGDP